MSRQCKACGKSFQPHQKVPDQQYCSSTICQRERRRLWQQEKRRLDADYRENDSRQIREWNAEHPNYWKRYRQINPDYADRNRNLQQARNKQRLGSLIANEDDLEPLPSLGMAKYLLNLIQRPA